MRLVLTKVRKLYSMMMIQIFLQTTARSDSLSILQRSLEACS